MHHLNGISSITSKKIRFMRVKGRRQQGSNYDIFNLLWMIVNDGFFLRVHSLDSERYLKMTCNCKLFSMLFFFVIIHVFDIEIILHIIPNVVCAHIIPVFHFGFPADFINRYSIKFRHEAFHHVPHYHTIIYMLYLLRTQSRKRRYIIRYTA